MCASVRVCVRASVHVRARACMHVCVCARAQANDRRGEEVVEVHVLLASCWPRVLPQQHTNNGQTVDFESPHNTSVWVAAEVR